MVLQTPRLGGGTRVLPFEYIQYFIGHIFAADIVGTFCQLLSDEVQPLTSGLIVGMLNGCHREINLDRGRFGTRPGS